MNKFLISIAALLLTIQFANAQAEKGEQTAGLNLAFSSLQNSNVNRDPSSYAVFNSHAKTTIFNIGPQYSYFIANNLDIAFAVSYNSTVTDAQNNDANDIVPYRQSSRALNL